MTTSAAVTMSPRVPNSLVRQTCESLFPKSSTASHNGRFKYGTYQDFGKVIRELLFTLPKKGFSADFFENVVEIGKLEGFSVRPSEPWYNLYCVRDPKWVAKDGTILGPSYSHSLEVALKRNSISHFYKAQHPQALTRHPSFNGTIGDVYKAKLVQRTPDGMDGRSPVLARTYFEGGDSFYTSDCSQKAKYLIGEDIILTTHHMLRIDKWFEPPPPLGKSSPSSLNEEHVFKDNLSSEYLSGTIPKTIRELAEVRAQELNEEEILAVLQYMDSMEMLKKFSFTSEEDKKKGREIATNFLAQLNFVFEKIIPNDLRALKEDIVSFPQIAYHLDFLMAPGPQGSFFLHDFYLAVQLLEEIQARALSLGLTENDQALLKRYIEENRVLDTELGGLIRIASEALKNSNYKVIPTPGAFFFSKTEENATSQCLTQDINFLNCLSGYSYETNHFYMIAAGTNCGDRLGDVLMDAYTTFLQQQCENLAVYFVGRKPENPHDFSEADYCLNKSNCRLGPHCLSFELRTEPCAPSFYSQCVIKE